MDAQVTPDAVWGIVRQEDSARRGTCPATSRWDPVGGGPARDERMTQLGERSLTTCACHAHGTPLDAP